MYAGANLQYFDISVHVSRHIPMLGPLNENKLQDREQRGDKH